LDADHSNQIKANGILRWLWLWNEEVSPDWGRSAIRDSIREARARKIMYTYKDRQERWTSCGEKERDNKGAAWTGGNLYD
jgi:hypothetical protein